MRRSDETMEHVRRLLGPANPVGPEEYADVPEARRALNRILATGRKPTPKARPHRRRWLVVSGGALALVCAGTVADASGIIPTSVTKGLLRGEEPHTEWGKLKTDQARMLVEAHGPGGVQEQWWFAPGSKAGGCGYLRQVTVGKGGRKHSDGSTECTGSTGPIPTAAEKLFIRYTYMAGDWMGVVGRAAPPATQIRVTLPDRRQILVPVRAGGFFMQFLDLRQVPYGPEQPKKAPDSIDATALDAAGHPITSVREEESSM